MPDLTLPTDDEWVINIKDSSGDLIGTITLDQLEKIHTEAASEAKITNEEPSSVLTEMLNDHLKTDRITPNIVAVLLRYKFDTLEKLKKSMDG